MAQRNITYGDDVFVLTRRDNTSAGYALLPKRVAENETDAIDFTAYFMNVLVRDGNLLGNIDPVALGRNLQVLGNVTMVPRKLVERGPDGQEGAVINVDRHEQGWYRLNTGTLKLPKDFANLSEELVGKETTVATVRYISNSTNSAGSNTTVSVTAFFLPDLTCEARKAVGIAFLFSVANFPFKYNSSQIEMVNTLSTRLNATNTTMRLPVSDFFAMGKANVNTSMNKTEKVDNSTLYVVEQQVTAIVQAANITGMPFTILEAFMVRRGPFDEVIAKDLQIGIAERIKPNCFFILMLLMLFLLW